MKQVILFLVILFLLWGNALWAEKLLVEYLEGMLEAKKGKTWIEVFTDDFIDADAMIRLAPDSLVELFGDNTRITLIKPGIYNIAEIIKATRDVDSYGLDSIISMKLKTIIDDAGEGQESNMGVRANKVTEYIGDDIVQDMFDLAEEEMKKENYDKAIRLFKDTINAVEVTDPGAESIQMFQYYIGYCHFRKGEDTQAMSFLMKIDVDPYAPYYTDYVLLYGKLLMKSLAYTDAITLFNGYIAKNKNEETLFLQDVYYLISICYINQDMLPEALHHLKKAEKLDPESEVGQKVHNIIKKLER